MSELKNCPFCGCDAVQIYPSDSWWYVACNGCFNRTFPTELKETAVQKWNIRNDRAVIGEFLQRVRSRQTMYSDTISFARCSDMVYAEMFPDPPSKFVGSPDA